MGTHPIFESDFDCLTEMVTTRASKPVEEAKKKAEEAEKKDAMEVEKTPAQKEEEKKNLIIQDIKIQLKEVEKAGHVKEPRMISKVLRQLPKTRRELSEEIMISIIQPLNIEMKSVLLNLLGCSQPDKSEQKSVVLEVELYISLLILVKLIDAKKIDQGKELADLLIAKVSKNQSHRRSADPLNAKIYYYHSRIYEGIGQTNEIRPIYMKCLRTTSIHNEIESESVLMNILLRNYMHSNLLDQAEKLVSKSQFPENANNNEWARYLYYTGRIKAIQLEYSDAQKTITTALRKAPQTSAIGFRQSATKLLTVVDLLMGDIPERSRFIQKSLERSLIPYYHLTQSVRTGNLAEFNKVLEEHGNKFKTDKTYTLILRLRHNVIKTGIRRISLSYSQISLADISSQLALDSPEDAEFIVAKAIRDGVIDAEIDHKAGTVTSKDKKDIYSTRNPEFAFDKRIQFCHQLHAQSVKAMRFPAKKFTDPLSAEERREREATDLEFAKEMAEEDEDMF